MISIKKYIIIFILAINYSISGFAQTQKTDESLPTKLANEQLNAYNNRDIEAFLKPYSDTIKVYSYRNKLLYKGKETMRKSYSKMFKELPDLNCKLVNRIVLGNKVIDHEEVTTHKNKPTFRAIAIYTIKEDKIVEVNFIQE